jgi:hypothetical protein
METARGAQPPAGRRERRAQRREAARARAAALGQHFELGELVISAEKTSEPAARTVGCMALVFAVLATPALYAAVAVPGLSAVARVILAAAVPVLLATGVGIIKTAPRPRTSRVLAYTGGLVQDDDGAAGPQAIPWALLDGVTHSYEKDDDGDPVLDGIRAVGLDGTVISINGGVGVSGLGRLSDYLDAVIVAMRLDAAIDQCAAGLPAQFGPLTVSGTGIAWDGGTGWAAWPDIRAVRLSRAAIELDTGTRWRGQAIGLADVPDSLVAILLVQELAGRLGIRQKNPPVDRPAPPPDDDRVLAVRTGVLSELDVSEILGRPAELVTAVGGGGRFAIRLFSGAGVTLSVVVLGPGAISGISQATGRRIGREVAGVGDRAWLVNQERTLIAVAGPATVKLTVSGLPPGAAPAALIPLAAAVIGRLGDAPGRAGGP